MSNKQPDDAEHTHGYPAPRRQMMPCGQKAGSPMPSSLTGIKEVEKGVPLPSNPELMIDLLSSDTIVPVINRTLGLLCDITDGFSLWMKLCIYIGLNPL